MSEVKTWPVSVATVVRTLDDGSSGQGAGKHEHLLVGRHGASGTRRNYRSYVKFTPDWTGVKRLISAVLNVYTDDTSEFGAYDSNDTPKVTVKRLTSAFTEHDSVGFESDDYTHPSSTTSGQVTKTMTEAVDGLNAIDITAIVKTWAPSTVEGGSGSLTTANARNHGIGLFGTTSTNEDWGGWSDDYDVPGKRPSLVLTYELGPTTPNTPTNLTPFGSVPSIGAFEGDFTDTRATDRLVQTQVHVYTSSAVKSGDADTDDTIDVTAHGFTVGQEVWFHSLTGGVGLSLGKAYYVRSIVNANSFKVSETVGGSVVNITDAYSALTVASPMWTKTKSASETEVLNDHSFVLPEGLTLARNTTYRWRMRQKDTDALWSPWCALISITVTNTDPDPPSNLTPDVAAGALDFATLNAVLFRGDFSDDDGDALDAFQVQMSDMSDPDDPNWDDPTFVNWDTGKRYVATGDTSWNVAYGGNPLTAGTYYWRARHWDLHDGLSDWAYASIVLTADFDPEPGTQTAIVANINAPWRLRIREMAYNSLAGTTGAITGSASTNTFTSANNHGLLAGRRVRISSLTGGTGLFTDRTYYVVSAGLAAKTFRLSLTREGTVVDFTTNVTAMVVTGVTTRGPGNTVAIIENAKSLGASIVYNSPGEAHFTLPVDHPQISVIEPKQTHYGIDFYTGDGWRETYAGLVWDIDANETDVVFTGFDYLALLDTVIDERYDPANPDKAATAGGSKYSDTTIRSVVLAQLNYAVALANSPVGFIGVSTIATMNEKVTIWSTMQPILSFIVGLLDSHRQGTGKKTRIKVQRTSGGAYQFVIDDDPGQQRDNLRLRYGELLNGYRVVVFGDQWASRMDTIGRTREGTRVMYKSASAPGIDQAVWGRIARAVLVDNVSDENDLIRRTKQAAIKNGKFGQGMAIAVRTGLLRPRDGYDVCDSFPVAINHGAVNTDNYGSGYWTCWAIAWEAQDNGNQEVTLTLSPREDSTAPDDDLIDTHPVSTQPEWQVGWHAPDPLDTSVRRIYSSMDSGLLMDDDHLMDEFHEVGGPIFIDVTTGRIYEYDGEVWNLISAPPTVAAPDVTVDARDTTNTAGVVVTNVTVTVV